MTKIYGWSPTEMREREDAFAALVDKKVLGWTKWARAKVVTSAKVLVATGAPAAPLPPPPVDLGSVAVITGMWNGSVSAEIMPALTEVYLTSASTVWQGINENFDLLDVPPVSDSFAEDYLASASNRLVAIGDLVWQNIRHELLVGFSLGESTSKLADRVSAAGQLSLARANVIARTEVNAASNAGAQQQVMMSGLVGTKEWLDTNDSRTRCTHKMAGGQTVDIMGTFKLGGPECGVGFSNLRFPGDPAGPPSEIIQCRCSVAYDLDVSPSGPPVITAAAEVQTGAMIALVPQATDATAMVLTGAAAEPADQLHVTLLYLGEAASWSAENRRLLLDVVDEIVAKYALIETSTFSVNVFNPTGDEFDTAVVLGVRGTDELVALHSSITSNVVDIFDDEVPEQHVPWVPHITLAYTDEIVETMPEAIEKLGSVLFDRVVVAFGGQYTYYSLIGPTTDREDVVTAAKAVWKEADHPRGPEGKFVKAAGDVGNIVDSIISAVDGGKFKAGSVVGSWTEPNGIKRRIIVDLLTDRDKTPILLLQELHDGSYTSTSSVTLDQKMTMNAWIFSAITGDKLQWSPTIASKTKTKPHPTGPQLDLGSTWDLLEEGQFEEGQILATSKYAGKDWQLVATQNPVSGGWVVTEQYMTSHGWTNEETFWNKGDFTSDFAQKIFTKQGYVPVDDTDNDQIDFDFADEPLSTLDLNPVVPSTKTSGAEPTPSEGLVIVQVPAVYNFKEPAVATWKDVVDNESYVNGEVVAKGKSKPDGNPLRIIAIKDDAGGWYLAEEEQIDGKWNAGRAWYDEESYTAADLSEYTKYQDVPGATPTKTDLPAGMTQEEFDAMASKVKIMTPVTEEDENDAADVIISPGTVLYTGGPLKNGNRDKIWTDAQKGLYANGDVVAEGTGVGSKSDEKYRLVAKIFPSGAAYFEQERLGPNGKWILFATYATKKDWDHAALSKFGIGKTGDAKPKVPAPTPTTTPTPPKSMGVGELFGALVTGQLLHGSTVAQGTDADGNHWKLVVDYPKLTFGGSPTLKEYKAGKFADLNDPNGWTYQDYYSLPTEVGPAKLNLYGLGSLSGGSTGLLSPPPTATPTPTAPTVMPTGPGTHAQLWDDMKTGKLKEGQTLGSYVDKNGSVHSLVVTKSKSGKWGIKHQAVTTGGSTVAIKMWEQGKLGEMEKFVATDLSAFKKPFTPTKTSGPATKPIPTLTNAIIYGKYEDGEVIATLGNPDLTKDSVQVRVIFEGGKIKKQANIDGTGWKTVQTMGKGEAYKNLKTIDGPWYLGAVDAPGTGGETDEGEPVVTSLPFVPPVAAVPTASPSPTSSSGISLTPTKGTAAENTHLGLWQKLQAGGFTEGEVVGAFSTGMFDHQIRAEKNAEGQWIFVHDKTGGADSSTITVNQYETTEDFLTAHIMDFQKPDGGKLVLTLPVPKKTGVSAVGITPSGVVLPPPAAQQKKIKTYFADKSVKWHTSSDTMLATAIEVQKDNPDLTLGQILSVMDQTTKTKTSSSPFTDKVAKYLGTAKGKQQFKESGLPSDTMSKTTSGTAVPGTSTPLMPIPGITPSSAGHGIYHEGEHHVQAPVGGWPVPSIADIKAIQKTMLDHQKWTPDEIKAIKAYTATSTSMNGCLRKPELCTTYVKKQTEAAAEGMRPLPVGIRTKRGTGWSSFPGAEEIYKTKGKQAAIDYMLGQEGRILVEPGFLSTSVGSGFGGDLRWQIDIPPGTPAAYVESITKVPGEQEVLLPPGMKYRIKQIQPAGPGFGSTLITLEVIYP